MRFHVHLFALASFGLSLAAAVPGASPIEGVAADLFPLIQAWDEINFDGDKIGVANADDVLAHPEHDGSTAICFNVPHNFISSLVLAGIEGEPWNGGKPYGCQLYSEDDCKGDSVWVQSAGWADVTKLMDLGKNYNFDKRTRSFKCWLKDAW